MTLSLGASIILIYTFIGYFYLRETFIVEDDGPKDFCTTMWICFINHLSFGMRAGGGIGE
jgi:hypothetical protein